MIHFLQHLSNARVAEEVIANAEQVRRDVVGGRSPPTYRIFRHDLADRTGKSANPRKIASESQLARLLQCMLRRRNGPVPRPFREI